MLAAALGSAKLLRSSISSHISVINNLRHLTEAHLGNYRNHNKFSFYQFFLNNTNDYFANIYCSILQEQYPDEEKH